MHADRHTPYAAAESLYVLLGGSKAHDTNTASEAPQEGSADNDNRAVGYGTQQRMHGHNTPPTDATLQPGTYAVLFLENRNTQSADTAERAEHKKDINNREL
jgi:hypothetical protein